MMNKPNTKTGTAKVQSKKQEPATQKAAVQEPEPKKWENLATLAEDDPRIISAFNQIHSYPWYDIHIGAIWACKSLKYQRVFAMPGLLLLKYCAWRKIHAIRTGAVNI